MSNWITPIFDRTQEDVDYAIFKLDEWKANGTTDIYELKGCLNVSDINRIEKNIQYLSDKLSEQCYFPHAITKTWDMMGLPNMNDINRIIGNIRNIIMAFFQKSTSPDLPNNMLNYEQVNAIEENLYLIKEILDNMVSSYRECGTFNCGED